MHGIKKEKENAAPEMTVGAAMGQHLCNHKSSTSNETPKILPVWRQLLTCGRIRKHVRKKR